MENSNRYPFASKNQIAAKIASDFSYACACLVVLWNRQTEYEQNTKSTLDRNKRGFMSSHAVHGSRIAQALASGTPCDELSPEDKARVSSIACRYTKQIAAHERTVAVKANPELAAQAAVFGL
jgi:hypothetical protein